MCNCIFKFITNLKHILENQFGIENVTVAYQYVAHLGHANPLSVEIRNHVKQA